MSSINILFVSQHFHPEIFRVNEIAAQLSSKGYTVDVLTGLPNYPQGKIYKGFEGAGFKMRRWGDISIFRLPIVLRRSANSFWLLLNYLSFIVSGILFGPYLLRKKKYDVIFCYATSPFIQVIPAIFLKWIKKARLVVNVQDLWPESVSATGHIKNQNILFIIGCVVDWIYRKSDILLLQSKAFEKIIKNRCPSVVTQYWPNSVAELFIVSNQKKVDYGLNFSEKFIVLFAGNIGKAQSIDTIIGAAEILKKNKDIKIVIAGDGSARDFLTRAISSRCLENLEWIGSFPLEIMPQLFEMASALLVTLSDEYIFSLTIPNKIQAYLAAGKPIIGAINGEGARVIIDSGAGYAVRSGDAELLADAILNMSALTPAELVKMGVSGREYFLNNFENQMLINQLIEVFEEQTKKLL